MFEYLIIRISGHFLHIRVQSVHIKVKFFAKSLWISENNSTFAPILKLIIQL